MHTFFSVKKIMLHIQLNHKYVTTIQLPFLMAIKTTFFSMNSKSEKTLGGIESSLMYKTPFTFVIHTK